MKCVVHNNTNATIVLPACFSSFPLPANGTKDFTYSTINGQDRQTLMTLATATPAAPQNPLFPRASIDFPGDVGLGIPAGLPINSNNLLYVLNDQEPADVPVGTPVFSLTDNETRRFTAGLLWVTDGRSKWLPSKAMSQNRYFASYALLPNGKIIAVGGSPDTAGIPSESLTSCEFYSAQNDKWTSAPSLPIPMSGLAMAVFPSGFVVVAGRASGSTTKRERPRTDSFILDLNNLNAGWVATKPLPFGYSPGGDTFHAHILSATTALVFGGIDSVSHGANQTTGATDNSNTSTSNMSFLFTLNAGTPANSSWDVTRDLEGSNVATLTGSGGSIAFYDHGGGLGVSTQLVKFTKSGAAFTSDYFGQPIVISAAANAENNGTFVIAHVESATEIWYCNKSAVAETGGSYSVGGAKPITQLPYRSILGAHTLQNDGKVFTAGGRDPVFVPTFFIAKTAQFNPTNGQWAQKATMPAVAGETETTSPAGARGGAGMATLSDGKILIAQGKLGPSLTKFNDDSFRLSNLLYDPSDDTFEQVGSSNRRRNLVEVVSIGNGNWLLLGQGTVKAGLYVDRFMESTKTVIQDSKKPATPSIDGSEVVKLPDGRCYQAGGRAGNSQSLNAATSNAVTYTAGTPIGESIDLDPEESIVDDFGYHS